MSPAPRIGRPKLQIDLSPSELAARKKAGIEPDAPLTEGEIKNREAEKQKLLARIAKVAPEPAPVKATVARDDSQRVPVADLMARLVTAGNRLNDNEAERQRAEAEQAGRAQVQEARSLETRLGQLQAKWRTQIEDGCAVDTDAVIRAVPEKVVPMVGADGRQLNVEVRHRAVRRYRDAAIEARTAISSTLGSERQGQEIRPVGLAVAAQQVENALTSRQTHAWDRDGDGQVVFVMSVGYRAAIVSLTWWIEKARGIVAAAERAVQKFIDAENTLREMLEDVEVLATPAPAKITLSTLPDRPAARRGGSSYQDFDPRSVMHEELPRDTVVITPVGNNDGLRVTGGDR